MKNSQRIINEKFAQSQQTLYTEGISMRNSMYELPKSPQEVFINPYPKPPLQKFPKNKSVRKQTPMTTLTESQNNPEKLCMRAFQKANKSTLDEIPETKRIARFGMCNPLSRSLDVKHQTSLRSFDDIGVSRNMKKIGYELKYKPDPIVVGDSTKRMTKTNSAIWKEDRRQRDNGKLTKQTLSWQVDSGKKKSLYTANRPQKKVDLSKSNIHSTSSRIFPTGSSSSSQTTDFSKVLNYQQRRR